MRVLALLVAVFFSAGLLTGAGWPGYTSAGPVVTPAPRTITGAADSPTSLDTYLIANRAGTVTLTFPAASSLIGKAYTVSTIQAQTVVSATSNVVPCAGGSASTAILAATAGKFATLVSDGTNWVIMACN